MLTLGQAAKETGVSKTAISRAVKSGRISAQRSDNGDYQIDPAELFRVYPVTSNGDRKAERDTTPKDDSGLQGVCDVLRELIGQIEAERDDLRRRLDSSEAARELEAEERRRLSYILTDQRQQPKSQPEAKPAPAAFLGGYGWLLAILAIAALGGEFFWVWTSSHH